MSRARVATTGLGAIGLVALRLVWQARWPDFGTGDWLAYWSAARGLLVGVGLYDVPWLKAVQSAAGFPGYTVRGLTFDTLPLWNPPPLILPLTPLGALDLTSATLLWIALGAWLFIDAALRFNRALEIALPAPLVLATALLALPLLLAARWGQATPHLAAMVIYAWLSQRAGRSVAAGVLLLPLLLKFQLFVVTLVLLLQVAWNRRAWGTLLALAGGLAGLTVALTVLDPGWLGGWSSQGLAWARTFSPWDLLTRLLALPPRAALVTLPLAVGVALYRYRARTEVPPALLAESALLSVLLAPYLWHHDTVVLLPAALWLGGRLWTRGWRWRLLVPPLLWFLPLVNPRWLAATVALPPPVGVAVRYQQVGRFYLFLIVVVVAWHLVTQRPVRS